MWKKLFSEAGVKNAVTLFHTPSSPASTRILSKLKDATASGTAKQASITLDVTENLPTGDQLKNMVEFLGEGNAGQLVEGAKDLTEAGRMMRMNSGALKRPIVVDWNAGKVVVGDNEADLDKIISTQND